MGLKGPAVGDVREFPRQIPSRGASLRHSPAAQAPGKLPLMEPVCGTALRHGPQAICQSAAQPCGTSPSQIASHRASLQTCSDVSRPRYNKVGTIAEIVERVPQGGSSRPRGAWRKPS